VIFLSRKPKRLDPPIVNDPYEPNREARHNLQPLKVRVKNPESPKSILFFPFMLAIWSSEASIFQIHKKPSVFLHLVFPGLPESHPVTKKKGFSEH